MDDKHTYENYIKDRNRKYCLTSDNFYLSESDFYPLSDNRFLKSYIKDINGGDNFADYCKYIFDLYEEEGYYD